MKKFVILLLYIILLSTVIGRSVHSYTKYIDIKSSKTLTDFEGEKTHLNFNLFGVEPDTALNRTPTLRLRGTTYSFPPNEIDNQSILRQWNGPILITADTIVPIKQMLHNSYLIQ
jgi:hypothetical protein